MSDSLRDMFMSELGRQANDLGLRGGDVNKMKKEFTEEEKNTERNSPEDYLINSDDMKEIYSLAKNKKLSANKIKEKIKDYLKEPIELKSFLKSILDSKGKKSENKEAMGTGGGVGAYEGPLFSKVETKEATSSGAGVGAYDAPGFQDVKMKGNTPKGKGSSWRKTQLPGGKFVQVKKKCKRFPYCNQGDIKALNIWNESNVERVIENMSKKYGLTENQIKEIISKEFNSNPKY
jgi:hypothetical protein